MQVQLWEYYEMVETLKSYHRQKNLFELFALTGGEDTKTLGVSARAKKPPLWNFYNICSIILIKSANCILVQLLPF